MMANALVSFETIPRTEDAVPYIDLAVDIIRKSGVKYVVGPMDTMMEGELEQLLEIVKQVNVELAKLGGGGISSVIKIHYDPKGISMAQMTERYE
ncbi:Uncharacterized conserved protein [Chlamydia abortus]|uniref:MTH1187 family thiamine-binding protein n=1 Tax=Paenibacillus residui TaxID=629724 RepID=A0ABW3DDK0_9BACL|nr:thiamine-binding protein [Paenibacillus sp. 32O-W]SHE13103.1 Uncharacterized conserved protein [Chlamydia abortus]